LVSSSVVLSFLHVSFLHVSFLFVSFVHVSFCRFFLCRYRPNILEPDSRKPSKPCLLDLDYRIPF
jgi:hypothetical protein